MAVSPNTVLGKYRILREIARSNDIVYEAIDPKMNRRVAVKELQLPLHLAGAQKRERVERFYREAKAAGTLTHPNIVTIHEVGQENDRHFLVMEYLDGQSLRDILQLQGALPLKETVEIALQMCEALAYAHAHGVVHRDVKPDNIHILPGGIIKLTDFGIARITAEPSITSQGQVFGTPSYMSPEQVASQAVDHRTDLFSMGITLYEMLTGRKPFVGDSVITITYNIMNSQPPMPVGVPPALQNILQKALAKDPNQRYQSAAAMSADLRAEKFALAAPQSAGDYGQGRPGGLGITGGGNGTMDTGHVPSSIAPFPGVGGSQIPPPYPMNPTPQAVPSEPAASYHPNGNGATPSQNGYSATQFSPMVGGLSAQTTGSRGGRRRSSRGGASNVVSLALAIFGLIALIALIAYGIKQAYNAVQERHQQHAAVDYTKQAYQALNSGNIQAATNSFKAAQMMAPPGTPEAQTADKGLSDTYIQQAQRLSASGDTAGAQQSFNKAIQYNSQNAKNYDDRANFRWFQQHDQNGAIDDWQSAIRADAGSPAANHARTQLTQIFQERAQSAAQSNNFTEARSDWQQIISINPGSPEAQQAQQNINNSPLPGQQ